MQFQKEEKENDFNVVLESKLAQKDYNFGGTFFPADTTAFEAYEFDAVVNFDGTTFVKGANFTRAQFRGAHTTFEVAKFNGKQTTFSGPHLNGEQTSF